MNRTDCLFQLFLCCVAIQLGMPIMWAALSAIFLSDKKSVNKIKNFIEECARISKRDHNMCRNVAGTENRLCSLKRMMFDGFRTLSSRLTNIRCLVESLDTKIRMLESSISPCEQRNPGTQARSTQTHAQTERQGQAGTPPAMNTRSRSVTTPPLYTSPQNAQSTAETPSRNVTFNLRNGSATAPIVSQRFYFRCNLCLVERFSSYRDINDLCGHCKPLASGDKVAFVRLFHDGKVWFCSCIRCKDGNKQQCEQTCCPECSHYRLLVSRNTGNSNMTINIKKKKIIILLFIYM